MSAHAFNSSGSHAVMAPRESFITRFSAARSKDDYFSRRMTSQWERAQELGLNERPYSEPRKIQRRSR